MPGRRIVRRFACGHLRTWDRRLASPVEHGAVAPFLRHAGGKRIHTPRSDRKQRRQDRAVAFGDSSTVGTPVVMTVAPRTAEVTRRVPFLTAQILRCSLASHNGVVCLGAHGSRKCRWSGHEFPQLCIAACNRRIGNHPRWFWENGASSKRFGCVPARALWILISSGRRKAGAQGPIRN